MADVNWVEPTLKANMGKRPDFQAECDRRKTWGCCWDGGTQCRKQDLLDDADMVYDAYYQKMATNGPNPTHCDFGGSAILYQ